MTKSCGNCAYRTVLTDGTWACDIPGVPVNCTPPYDDACDDWYPKEGEECRKN